MSTSHQKRGLAGVLLHKVEVHCPKCSNLESHWIKDLNKWEYTKKEAVKIFNDKFVQIYCSNDGCGNVFAVKPKFIDVEWEIYNRVKNEGVKE